MTAIERCSLLNSFQTLLNDDSDFSRFESRLTGFGNGVLFSDMQAKPEFNLSGTSGSVSITSGEAIITTTRVTSSPITGKRTPVRYQLSDTKVLTGNVSGSKIYIEIDQTLIDNPTLIQDTYPSTDYANGLNIAELKSGLTRPTTNSYIPLWELSGITRLRTDLRQSPKILGNRIDFVDVDGNISTEGNITAQDITAIGNLNAQSSYANDFYTPDGGLQEQIDQIITDIGTVKAIEDNTYMAGENINAGNCLFLEGSVSFASATTEQKIGYDTDSTRVSVRRLGSGVASDELKLSLKKLSSPGVALGIRIETDNGGQPSGTLVDADAHSTIAAGDLTTGLQDITVTLAGSITIPRGQIVWIVLFQGTYGSETLNTTNYYALGYNGAINTTTQVILVNDGSIRGANLFVNDNFLGTALNASLRDTIVGADITVNDSIIFTRGALGNPYINEFERYVKSVATYSGDIVLQSTLYAITNHVDMATNTAQYLYRDADNYIKITQSYNYRNFFANVTIQIVQGGTEVYAYDTYGTGISIGYTTKLKIYYNRGTNDIKCYYWNGLARVQLGVTQNLTFTGDPYVMFCFYGGNTGGSSADMNGSVANMYLTDTDYITQNPVLTSYSAYVGGDLFESNVLSKTDATYPYKTTLYGISTEDKSMGEFPKLTIDGLNDNQNSLIYQTDYFLATVPGEITPIQNTYGAYVGIGKIPTGLLMDGKKYSIVEGTTFTALSLPTARSRRGDYLKVKSWTVQKSGRYNLIFSAQHTDSSDNVYNVALYKDGVITSTVVSATGYNTYVTYTIPLYFVKGSVYDIYLQCSGGGFGSVQVKDVLLKYSYGDKVFTYTVSDLLD